MTFRKVIIIAVVWEVTTAIVGGSVGGSYPWLVYYGVVHDRLHILPRFIDDHRGVVAIEAALLLPVFTLLFAVMVLAGMGFYSQSSLTFATQQAALATVAGTNAQAIFAGSIPATLTGATVSCAPVTGGQQCTGTGSFSVPFAGLFNASPTMNLTATAMAATP